MRRKRQKACVERSCRSCVLCLTSLLRSIASYTLFPRKKWDRLCRNYYTVIPSQREANKAMLYKGGTGNLKTDGTSSGFGTDGSSLFRKKSQVPSNQNHSFFKGLMSNTRLGQAKSAPEQGRTQSQVSLTVSSGHLRKPWVSLALNSQGKVHLAHLKIPLTVHREGKPGHELQSGNEQRPWRYACSAWFAQPAFLNNLTSPVT